MTTSSRQKALLAAGVAAAIALIGAGGAILWGPWGDSDEPSATDVPDQPEQTEAERQAQERIRNTLRLAEEYIEDGEYQRALDLLDQVLIEDSDNEIARDLRTRAVAARREAEEADDEALSDTDAVEQAEAEARRLEAQARAEEAEARRREAELAVQQELAAQREAEARRRAEEERRREAERQAELERLNAEEREKTESIQSLLARAREQLENEEYARARDTLDAALEIELEDENTENRLHAEALATTAQSYFSQNPENSDNRREAIEHANEALRR
ncbi:MAG TPA: hypothetical protein VJ932_01230, partial [Alkalispirochaeta sp.]|nr:hypothetical protein [Alkalispirochaeta sp.]